MQTPLDRAVLRAEQATQLIGLFAPARLSCSTARVARSSASSHSGFQS
jgi:hypothetical protein